MVAKITTPSTITKALNYNEKKVQKGAASCLYAGNFLKDAGAMNFYEKRDRFKRLIALNTRAKTNSLHISLNFHPSETVSREKLVQIATSYMEKIGFGAQPYLVYEHRDAGHPHLHIVTTSIREDGSRIVTQNIGRNQSQKARKEIEEAFGLVKASGRKTTDALEATTQKIQYGKADTKRSITNVLHTVFSRYQVTSLPALNAVLRLYNLTADRGEKEGRIYKNGGLLYRVLDDAGNKVGIPIKASALSFQPTLAFLETQFQKGEAGRPPHKQKLKTAIDFVLQQQPRNLDQFTARLKEEKISAVLRKNADAFVYGVTYIDHRTGAVFNGSDLGKEYSAAALQTRIQQAPATHKKQDGLFNKGVSKDTFPLQEKDTNRTLGKGHSPELPDLLKIENDDTRIPYEFRKKKKKRRGFNL